jgi:hypothetical protein
MIPAAPQETVGEAGIEPGTAAAQILKVLSIQWKLTGVLSGINRKLMIYHCSDGYSFFNLKGLHSLKSKNMFSALTGTLF